MEELSLTETKRLGQELLISRSNVNNAPILLSILSSNSITPSSATSSDPSASATQCRLEALHSLHAFFIPLLRTGKFFSAARKEAKQDIEAVAAPARDTGSEHLNDGGGNTSRHAEGVYILWVWNKYREFKKSLFRIVAQPTNVQVLQIAVINTLMDLVRDERCGEFNNSLYLKICTRMVEGRGERNEILQVLVTKYFKYSDITYFTYRNIEKLVTKRLTKKQRDQEIMSSDEDNDQDHVGVSLHTFARNVYDILSRLPPPSTAEKKDDDDAEELWSNSLGAEDCDKNVTGTEQGKNKNNSLRPKELKKQKYMMSRAWLSYLQLSLPLDVYKKILAKLHRNVIPHLTNPILLSDFLTKSYNTGGLISVMALGSLFILISKYGLEYPKFYNKLYALLEPSIFVAKYRSRFFELLDTCLHSSHLPGYLGAAFAKRLGRLVLSAPPSGAIIVIALIHNLLRRHPSINILVHRLDSIHASTILEVDPGNDGEGDDALNLEQKSEDRIAEGRHGADPFIASEADVAKCNALKSSLWEIESLRRHYCPVVSRFVESLEMDLTVRAKTTEVVIGDFSMTSYATIFGEEVGRRLKSVPLAFYSTVPNTLFPESNFDGSFSGWRFKESGELHLESLIDLKGKEDQHIENKVEEVNISVQEEKIDNSSEEDHSEELSSDGSRGSRSRSEQSEGDDWPQPLLKKLRGSQVV